MLPCLDAAAARSVVEVGAFAGDLTRVLVDWARGAGAHVARDRPRAAAASSWRSNASAPGARADPRDEPRRAAADPAAGRGRDRRRPQLLDGARGAAADRRAAPGAELPLLLFHDVCWPHARRDDYFAPEQIPAERRQPLAGDRRRPLAGRARAAARRAAVPALGRARGRAAQRRADRDRGLRRPRREQLRLAVVPAFFGLGARVARATRRGRTPWPRILDPLGPQPACWSGWRPTGSTTSRSRTPGRVELAAPASAAGARRRCCDGCWTRARSRSRSGCRGCAPRAGSPPRAVGGLQGRGPPGARGLSAAARAAGAARLSAAQRRGHAPRRAVRSSPRAPARAARPGRQRAIVASRRSCARPPARPRRAAPAASSRCPSAAAREAAVPLLGQPDVGLGPQLQARRTSLSGR